MVYEIIFSQFFIIPREMGSRCHAEEISLRGCSGIRKLSFLPKIEDLISVPVRRLTRMLLSSDHGLGRTDSVFLSYNQETAEDYTFCLHLHTIFETKD